MNNISLSRPYLTPSSEVVILHHSKTTIISHCVCKSVSLCPLFIHPLFISPLLLSLPYPLSSVLGLLLLRREANSKISQHKTLAWDLVNDLFFLVLFLHFIFLCIFIFYFGLRMARNVSVILSNLPNFLTTLTGFIYPCT